MDFIKWYAKLVVEHPFWVVFISFLFIGYSMSNLHLLETKQPKVDEILPSSLEVTQGLYKLQDNLGGGESTAFMVVMELDVNEGSDILDIRDPRVLEYSEKIGAQVMNIEDVTGYDSLAKSLYDLNGGKLNSLPDVKNLYEENSNKFSRIVNDKYSLMIMRIYANEGFDVSKIVSEVQKIIDNTEKPVGVKVVLSGEEIARKVSKDLTNPDSAKTSMISMIAIIAILLITFRSFMYSFLPLLTIIFGVIWMLGFMAISGIQMSSFTAGAISMIIGIGIDFGIQSIMRFKQELAKANPVLALKVTLENVLKPMFITTCAAFIGFWSMTLGDFLVLGELGKAMAFGVIFCFLAAASIVPAMSIIYEKYKPKKFNSPKRFLGNFVKLITGRVNLK